MTRLAWVLLYLAAAFSLAVESGRWATPREPDLARLPVRLGELEVLGPLDFDPDALGSRPPERHAYLAVRDPAHPAAAEGKLFIAYYRRAQRWSGRPHDVEKCFAAAGWDEREAHRLDGPQRPWSRRFERDGQAIRVVHWLERPGADEDLPTPGMLLGRLRDGRGWRPDVASIYLEFPAEAAPSDERALEAVSALSAAIESLW